MSPTTPTFKSLFSTKEPDSPTRTEKDDIKVIAHEGEILPLHTVARTPPPQLTLSNAPTATELSFALPTSLAFFKRLTWELTPWAAPKIPAAVAKIISSYYPPHMFSDHTVNNPSLSATALTNAICLGVSYDALTNGPKTLFPHLYVVFPHLSRDVSRDETFLRAWHDDIVKPAFDKAWLTSGLVRAWENTENGTTGSSRSAPPASSIIPRLHLTHFSDAPIHHTWPEYLEPWERNTANAPWPSALLRGLEGRYSEPRARLFHQAWESMRGMIRGHSDLKEMQDPVLLAVWETKARAGDGVAPWDVVKYVGREWDLFVDSRWVEKGRFVVHLEEQVGSSAGGA